MATTRFTMVWCDVPKDQYRSLPADVQAQVDDALELLSTDPVEHGTYDRGTDHWSTPFGGGNGFILYALSREHSKVMLLRIIAL